MDKDLRKVTFTPSAEKLFVEPALPDNMKKSQKEFPPFESPPAGAMNADVGRTSDLALITPEKRLVTLEHNQVRKRPYPLSPSQSFGNETKKKQVAKCLVFNHSGSTDIPLKNLLLGNGLGGGTSKCLFGPPSDEENRKILQEMENNNKKEFEKFEKRYVIEEEMDVNY